VALERLRDIELKCLVEVDSFYFTVNVYFILSENHHAPSSDASYRILVDYFKIWTLEGGGGLRWARGSGGLVFSWVFHSF
jgi:hypothetical protein